MPDFLTIEAHGPVLLLTMSQPDMRNALSGNSAIDEFLVACDRVERDPAIRAVVITGADPAFSSGGSLKAMRADWKGHKEGVQLRQQLRNGVQRLCLALYKLEVATIAAVNGPAIGGGCDLACVCDVRIASERAAFAANFVKIGIVPALGGAWLLSRLLGPSKAAELCLTGDVIDAPAALGLGLVSRVVPHEALLPQAMDLARRIACNSGHALRMTKRLLRAADVTDLATNLDMAAGFQALALHSGDHEQAVQAFEKRRLPDVKPQ